MAHNFYRSEVPSGENAAVNADIQRLRDAGVSVETLFEYSDLISRRKLGRARAALRMFGSREMDDNVTHAVRDQGANLLHIHNLYPLISPSIIRTAKRLGIPVIASVYNYRLVCAKGTFYRDGAICTECAGLRVAWPAVQHGCYRDSRIESGVVTAAMGFHAGTWALVDRYIAVSPFIAEFLEGLGIPSDQISTMPNLPAAAGSPPPEMGAGVLYAGRLDPAKGINLLLEAWETLEPDPHRPLVIAGDGPARAAVLAAEARRPDIRFVGARPPSAVGELIDSAAATCMPSLWFEGLPMIFIESIAHGRPVVATTIGSLGRLVNDRIGWLVQPTVSALASALAEARVGSIGRGARAREVYEQSYAEPAGINQLVSIYADVLGRHKP
jgi:glycosyltransferase involved in cell wall biosynthesis